MKKILPLLLSLLSFSGFAATEQMIWMKPMPKNLSYQVASMPQTQASDYAMTPVVPNESVAHQRYSLTYRGISIFGSQIIVHRRQNRLPLLTGVLVQNLEKDLTPYPRLLSAKDAQETILNQITTPIKAKTIEPTIYIDEEHVAHHAYWLHFYTTDPTLGISQPHYIIDANHGDILKQWNDATTLIDGEGPGGNQINLPYRDGAFQYGTSQANLPSLGKFPMEQWGIWCYFQTPDFRVINLKNAQVSESSLPYIFPIYDSEESTYHLFADNDFCWPSTRVFQNVNDHGTAPVNDAFSPNNDAMYFVQKTLELYQSLGVDYPLGQVDLPIRVYTHLGGFDNAFALPTIYKPDGKTIKAHQQIVLSNGEFFFSALTQSVIPHELSHNFTRLHSNLIYKEQSGGINEAFSDMAAIALMDRLHQQYSFYWDDLDWTIGRESSKKGQALRYMEHPAQDGRSIEHQKDYTNKLDVHLSSGVFNRAFYLLAHHPDWSTHDAFLVMVDANQNYWTPNTSFDQAACGVIQAARDRNRDTTAVVDAFSRVGVSCPFLH